MSKEFFKIHPNPDDKEAIEREMIKRLDQGWTLHLKPRKGVDTADLIQEAIAEGIIKALDKGQLDYAQAIKEKLNISEDTFKQIIQEAIKKEEDQGNSEKVEKLRNKFNISKDK